MHTLSRNDLESFRQALIKDYGFDLNGAALYDAAFDLLNFFEALIKFDRYNSMKSEDGCENRPRQPIETPIENTQNEQDG